MAALTPTSHAVIGLLAVRSQSTYELAKQVERSLGWFWPRTQRKIYDEARALVERGLATSSTEMVGKRKRTVYSITRAGRAALAAWLAADSAPMKLESEALVKVFFAERGSLDALRATLDRMQTEAEAKLAVLQSMGAAMYADDYAYADRIHVNALTLRFQLLHHESVIAWARWAREQTSAWASTHDPQGWDWQSALAEWAFPEH